MNNFLGESLIWKTKRQKLQWYHKFAMERKKQQKCNFRN